MLAIVRLTRPYIDGITLGIAGAIAAGVIPESPQNVADYTTRTALTQGPPQIVTAGTNAKSFDAKSFYFGQSF